MPAFTFTVTLSAVIGAQVIYSSPEHQFKDYDACQQTAPQVERAVQGIINRDPRSLQLFGWVSGPISRAYFVTDAVCDDDREQ
jgi:hypothetical protein